MIDLPTTDKRPVKLSELTKEIASVINQHFSSRFYWVIAEITNHKFVPKSGYHYFDLTEKHGVGKSSITRIACSAFSIGAESIRNFEKYTLQKFGSNIEVLVKIKVDYSMEYGLRTILSDIDVAFTIGNLEKIKQQTLEKLLVNETNHIKRSGDEILTTNKRLNFPLVVRGIALITSNLSEGYTDFLHTLLENDFGYKFHVFPFLSSVQSETAASEIVESLKQIHGKYLPYIDAVVICRGGGAQTDFMAFNDYNLCRAVARFPVPIITGIGHHSNQSLVDLMAHTETKTPTKAAEFVVNWCHAFEDKLLWLEKSIMMAAQRTLARRKTSLSELNSQIINQTRSLLSKKRDEVLEEKAFVINTARSLLSTHREESSVIRQNIVSKSNSVLSDSRNKLVRIASLMSNKPLSILAIENNNLKNEQAKLAALSKNYLTLNRTNLAHYDSLFRHFNIDNLLQKGFAIVRKGAKVIGDPSKINMGDNITVQMRDTSIDVTVNNIQNGTGTDL